MNKEILEHEYELWLEEAEKTSGRNLLDPFLKFRDREDVNEDFADECRRNVIRRRYKKELHSSYSEDNPIVSVIIPTYRRNEFIRESVGSVLQQTFKNFTLMVINDGGSDELEDILRTFKDNRIEYFKVPHRGLSRALNIGLWASGSKYISYLDDDDIYYPEHLESLVTLLEEKNLEVAYSDTYCVRQEKRDDQYITLEKELYSKDFDPPMMLVRNCILAPLAIMHRRDCLKSVGYFNEKLPVVMDWDLWAHMAQKFKFNHVKKPTGEYRVRTDGTNISSNRMKMKVYSDTLRLYLMNKYLIQKLPDLMSQGDSGYAADLLKVYLGEYPCSVYYHFLQGICYIKSRRFYYGLKAFNRGFNYFMQPFWDDINYMGEVILEKVMGKK